MLWGIIFHKRYEVTENEVMLILKNSKLLKIIAGTLILVLIIGLGFLIAGKMTQNDKEDGKTLLIEDGPCSERQPESILSEAASIFLASNVVNNADGERATKVLALEDRILKQDNHTQDANCLHILTMTNISRSNAAAAEKYLTMLKEGLQESDPSTYILDENVNFWTLEKMNDVIEGLKSNAKQVEQNNPYGDQTRLHEKTD